MNREQLELYKHVPVVRYLLYLMDDRKELIKRKKIAEERWGEFTDRIECAKAFIELAKGGEG